jgi:hypothetical protein
MSQGSAHRLMRHLNGAHALGYVGLGSTYRCALLLVVAIVTGCIDAVLISTLGATPPASTTSCGTTSASTSSSASRSGRCAMTRAAAMATVLRYSY